jgi:hypothetical protein
MVKKTKAATDPLEKKQVVRTRAVVRQRGEKVWLAKEKVLATEALGFRHTDAEVTQAVRRAYLRGYGDGVEGKPADFVTTGIPPIDTGELRRTKADRLKSNPQLIREAMVTL